MEKTIRDGSQPAAVSACALEKTFKGGSVVAVAGVDLEIRQKEVVAVLGKNGAGKTTLMDMVVGLTSPTAGEVWMFGLPPRQAVAQGLVGTMLQTGGLLPNETVRSVIRMIASVYDNPMPVEQALEFCDLVSIADRKISKCSGGEQQRLKLALALIGQPALLILDEPTSGMDPASRSRLWSMLHQIAKNGTTIVFSTHYLKEAEDFAHRVILLSNGKVVGDGAPHSVFGTEGRVTVEYKASGTAVDLEAVEKHTAAQSLTQIGDTYRLLTSDSDAAARFLLAQPGVSNLRIYATSLDEIFAELEGSND